MIHSLHKRLYRCDSLQYNHRSIRRFQVEDNICRSNLLYRCLHLHQFDFPQLEIVSQTDKCDVFLVIYSCTPTEISYALIWISDDTTYIFSDWTAYFASHTWLPMERRLECVYRMSTPVRRLDRCTGLRWATSAPFSGKSCIWEFTKNSFSPWKVQSLFSISLTTGIGHGWSSSLWYHKKIKPLTSWEVHFLTFDFSATVQKKQKNWRH